MPLDYKPVLPDATSRIGHSCLLAKQCERVGEYQQGREALDEWWIPTRENYAADVNDESMRAELLLRVGSLTGFLASANQVSGEHDLAKELIAASLGIFERLAGTSNTAEAHGDLALCYWREGSFDEARIHLTRALDLLGDVNPDLRATLLVRSGIIEQRSGRPQEAWRFYSEAAPLIEQSQDHSLKGSFHVEYGLILRKLAGSENRTDYLDRALIEYSAASFHFEQANNERYLARVENNLGYLYFTVGRFAEARAHMDRARYIFEQLGDVGNVAQVDDSRARLLLAQGSNVKAERMARAVVKLVERGGEVALLGEALITHGTSLARMGKYALSQTVLQRAMDVSLSAGNVEGAGLAALSMLEELETYLPSKDQSSLFDSAAELLRRSEQQDVHKRLVACARKVLVDRVPANKRKLRVFLCHAKEDKETVRTVYEQLLSNNVEPWFDQESLLPGQDWEMEIAKAVRTSDAVVVCLSKTSTGKAGFVQKEINHALDVADRQPEGAIFIIPLKLEKCEVPARLGSKHSVDYFELSGLTRLLKSLRKRAEDLDTLLPRSRQSADIESSLGR